MATGNGMRLGIAVLAAVGLFGLIVLAVPPRTGEEGHATAQDSTTPAQGPAQDPAQDGVASPPPAPGLPRDSETGDRTDSDRPADTPSPPQEPPRFDTVRLSPDGSGIVAGRADPGERVTILAGDIAVAEAVADGEGRFVAFLDLPPSTVPRPLALRDESGTPSEATVILAPTPFAFPGEETATGEQTGPEEAGAEEPAPGEETTAGGEGATIAMAGPSQIDSPSGTDAGTPAADAKTPAWPEAPGPAAGTPDDTADAVAEGETGPPGRRP
ncbi:hypothetical protein ruthe_00532 [Rubellimicrobium thermophilum DSM 16684]|uniref:Uncharacterized protein n=1 Tax=Rubellimicrobium thermophilum DSM 16684 TaxID=1123069 RepID=S9R6D2_9RHOB|nr:hypothetical protein [Rubellimicrobium thermophilum]EPX87462.1 hypothetical protein ruthe_00532 [Rubellimicrobium thermophilum DSM 16684]